MKTYLKENIYINGFDDIVELYYKSADICIDSGNFAILYEGKTSDISEEIAEQYANKGELCEYYWNEQLDDYDRNISAKESILSACSEEYCIIYKSDDYE
jgi:hypothetical protein